MHGSGALVRVVAVTVAITTTNTIKHDGNATAPANRGTDTKPNRQLETCSGSARSIGHSIHKQVSGVAEQTEGRRIGRHLDRSTACRFEYSIHHGT